MKKIKMIKDEIIKDTIIDLYMKYSIVVNESSIDIDIVEVEYILWLTIMGMQDTANSIEGVIVRDMIMHPKIYEEE